MTTQKHRQYWAHKTHAEDTHNKRAQNHIKKPIRWTTCTSLNDWADPGSRKVRLFSVCFMLNRIIQNSQVPIGQQDHMNSSRFWR